MAAMVVPRCPRFKNRRTLVESTRLRTASLSYLRAIGCPLSTPKTTRFVYFSVGKHFCQIVFENMYCLSKTIQLTGLLLFQSCLNRFSLPCGRFSPKHEILHFPPRKTNAKLPLRKANAKLPPRTLRKSKPESPMSLKASPKPQCPVQDFFIKEPCSQLRCRRRNRHFPLSSGEPDPRPASSCCLETQDAAPSDESRPRAPLRPIRSKPLCTRAAAQPDPARPGGRSSDQWP